MDTLSALLKLSGMAQHSGEYTALEWKDKTGIDPRNYPQYIQITRHNGLCVWTAKAQDVVQRHCAIVQRNWHALGISA